MSKFRFFLSVTCVIPINIEWISFVYVLNDYISCSTNINYHALECSLVRFYQEETMQIPSSTLSWSVFEGEINTWSAERQSFQWTREHHSTWFECRSMTRFFLCQINFGPDIYHCSFTFKMHYILISDLTIVCFDLCLVLNLRS